MTEQDVWDRADRIASAYGGEPPSERQWLVQRVAWALHVMQGSESPRKEWLEMDRAPLYASARAAIDAYEAHQPKEQR